MRIRYDMFDTCSSEFMLGYIDAWAASRYNQLRQGFKRRSGRGLEAVKSEKYVCWRDSIPFTRLARDMCVSYGSSCVGGVYVSPAPKTKFLRRRTQTMATRSMKMMKAMKASRPEVYTVKAYPHLGLGLKMGQAYKASYLRSLCKGSSAKTKKLEKVMKDETYRRRDLKFLMLAPGCCRPGPPRGWWMFDLFGNNSLYFRPSGLWKMNSFHSEKIIPATNPNRMVSLILERILELILDRS